MKPKSPKPKSVSLNNYFYKSIGDVESFRLKEKTINRFTRPISLSFLPTFLVRGLEN